jgi:molybdopterin-containing oxidoreductase family membrane subunit
MSIPDSKTLLKDFTPEIEKTSLSWRITFIFMVLIFLLGILGLNRQISGGHIVTGMRDYVVWGIYIVNFIFFMGLSYAGALISGVLLLFKSEWRKPVIRIAELITVISLLIGPFFIFLCVGRLDRLYFLAIYPRIQSPITWDVIAISTDLIGCALFLYLSILQDIALLRDSAELVVPKWKKRVYNILAMGYKDTPTQRKHLRQARNVMAAMIIAIAIIVYSVLAWIFGVTLQPGWHSTIFGPYFVIAAVFSGTGLMIIIMWIFRKVYRLEKYITIKHFTYVGYLLLIIGAFYGYFTFADYLTKWYGSQKMDAMLIDKLFTEYFWLFIFANYAGIIIPVIIIGIGKLRTINNIFVAAIVSLLALWINRFLIVIPTLETPYLPIQDYRADWIHYSSTWVEWSLSAAGVAIFVILLMLFSKLIPIISISEMIEPDESAKENV